MIFEAICASPRLHENPRSSTTLLLSGRVSPNAPPFSRRALGPRRVPLRVASGDRSMGEVTATVAEALRQSGATDVRSATITRSSHWGAEEQSRRVRILIDRLAAGSH